MPTMLDLSSTEDCTRDNRWLLRSETKSVMSQGFIRALWALHRWYLISQHMPRWTINGITSIRLLPHFWTQIFTKNSSSTAGRTSLRPYSRCHIILHKHFGPPRVTDTISARRLLVTTLEKREEHENGSLHYPTHRIMTPSFLLIL